MTGGGEVLPYIAALRVTFYERQAALIGGDAYCATCNSTGQIIKSGGPRRPRYLNVREVALDGDIVLCGCATPQAIIGLLARESWCDDLAERSAVAVSSQSSSHQPISKIAPLRYGEQFTLRDGNGRALPDTLYTIRDAFGSLVRGVTDSTGKTGRYRTNGPQSVRLYIGHRETIQ
ncbi:PAAR domain-containing protein [Paraburkholderia caffeinilytica]|uniref:PAAR domain-containing protein n=1 Tax=Paraburkholderia caffeinilytica TaxID=1761016 RepID=UPI0013BEAAF4|nr:PAAR domain-containing protein [Paraburkholderia caffeinilytica]